MKRLFINDKKAFIYLIIIIIFPYTYIIVDYNQCLNYQTIIPHTKSFPQNYSFYCL